MMLLSQHPQSVIAGLVAAIVYTSEVPAADNRLADKFGEPYLRYKEQVPALNFITGTIRFIKKKYMS
jgi:protein-S-isoprenylcysteine O-methyltransferase Ste14